MMAAALYPVLYVLAASFSSFEFLAQGKVGIIPMGFTLDAYKRILSYPMLDRAYLNTFFYTIAGTIISMLLSALAAYPLSRRPFPGQKFMSSVIVVAMLFSAGMIPTFLVVTKLHMYNTVWAMLIPTAVSSFNVVLLKNFFQQIPYELEESASLDGCSQMMILFRIILPLSMSGVVTVGLFYAIAQWNSYFPAMLYLRDRALVPMQIILRDIVIQNQTNDLSIDLVNGSDQISESVKYATIMVATIPIMLVYPFIQKYFVKGIMVGSVKG
jgi:putative aldouronate transport system permease protein